MHCCLFALLCYYVILYMLWGKYFNSTFGVWGKAISVHFETSCRVGLTIKFTLTLTSTQSIDIHKEILVTLPKTRDPPILYLLFYLWWRCHINTGGPAQSSPDVGQDEAVTAEDSVGLTFVSVGLWRWHGEGQRGHHLQDPGGAYQVLGGEVLVAGDAGQHGVSLRRRTCCGWRRRYMTHELIYACKKEKAIQLISVFIYT